MKIRLIVLFAFMIIAVSSNAQKNTQCTIHLKNGSMIVGEILSYTQGEQMKFKLPNDVVIDIKDESIEKIIYPSVRRSNDYAFKERGLYFQTSVSGSFGLNSWNDRLTAGYGMHQIVGFQFHRGLGAGAGIGYDAYFNNAGQQFIPVFAEVRGYVRERNFTPMYSLAAGYGFTPGTVLVSRNLIESKGGYYIYPAFGFRFGGNPDANFIMDFGYKVQKGTFTYDEWNGTSTQEITFQRLTIRTALLF